MRDFSSLMTKAVVRTPKKFDMNNPGPEIGTSLGLDTTS
jgi:hypothetical protein